VKVIAETRRAH